MQRRVLAGSIMYPISMVRDVLALYGDYGAQAPDELQIDGVLMLPPGGAPGIAGFGVCYSGSPSRAERVLAPLRSLGTPIVDNVQGTDYVALQRSGDTDDVRATASYLKSGFIGGFPDGLISAIAEGLEGHPARGTQLIFQQGGGAIARVPDGATAFSQRGEFANMLCQVAWPYGADGSEHTAWIREFWTHVEPFTRGFYTNDLEDGTTAEAVNANFRDNFDRLVAVKNRYDPNNLFRLNANVVPSV
jgi:FAD/FMN-containing dehydrogenase